MDNIVKIKSIEITNIHRLYDYIVVFNDDITFLHGENGAGKTTVINILSSIISGNLTELLHYSFDSIVVEYSSQDLLNKIIINDKEKNYVIKFLGKEKKYSKEFLNYLTERRYYPIKDLKEYLIFQKQIQEIFNCIYLPLNRVNEQIFNNETIDYISKLDELNSIDVRHTLRASRNSSTDKNDMVQKALEVLKRNLEKINNEKLEHYKQYSESLASIGFDMINPSDKLDLPIKSPLDVENILDLYSQGIKILNKKTKPKIISDFKDQYIKFQKDINNLDSESLLKYIVMTHDLQRYKKIADLIKEFNTEENLITERKDTFVRILNSFLGLSMNYGKNIDISDSGEIKFINIKDSEINGINPEQLSSGEMQLFVFFTHLVFEVPNNGGVFLVDEPELSLHINWQELLAKAIHEANKNIQVIFATHSPDIIGNQRDKLEKIDRKIHKTDINSNQG